MLNPLYLWLVREPADMRAGITTLTRLATVAAGHPPRDGEAFLFILERTIRSRPAEQKRRWRRRYARPRMEAFHAWLSAGEKTSAPGGALHGAITYALKRWPALTTYLDDGRVPVDNNRCEQMMRPVAQGRKSWLFAGSLRGGERMAELMTLLHTARLNGLEPVAWLRDVLEKLPSWPASRLDELLPYRRQVD